MFVTIGNRVKFHMGEEKSRRKITQERDSVTFYVSHMTACFLEHYVSKIIYLNMKTQTSWEMC